jgi:phosphatidylinositol alpha 1,6-mannosyltransferase
MRIAVFSEVYWPMVSGVGVTLPRLTEALERRGHAVRVYSATYPLPPGTVDRPEAYRSPSIPLFLYPDIQWAFPRQRELEEDLAAFRPDVVHLATEFAMGLAGLRAAQHLGIPIIASSHTDYQKYAQRYGVAWVLEVGWIYGRWFYSHAARVLCPSRVHEEYLHTRGILHTGLWTRGLDPEHFHPRFRSEEYRRALGLRPDDFLVTYIGRIAREKDIKLLLKAWQAVASERGGAQLVLVGGGPLAEDLLRASVPGVHLTGIKQGPELSAAYASADLFVFPSATETFGNSLLEAMGSGVPSLAVSAGGVLEFARNGENALLVGARDVGAFAGGLRTLMGDAALRRRLAEGGLRTAASRSWDPIYDKLLADYRWTTESGSRVRAA